jgi:hypothetical protein
MFSLHLKISEILSKQERRKIFKELSYKNMGIQLKRNLHTKRRRKDK